MTKKYKLIYADPPWQYNNINTGGSLKSGAAAKYNTLSLDEIKSLKVERIADNNSVLFLWVTTPLLLFGLEVINAWGYKYKTALYWNKKRFGMGFWFRGQVDILLLGVRGKIKPFKSSIRNFYEEKSFFHSRKPEYFYTVLESLNLIPRIELFATKKRASWDSLGLEIDKKDIREILK